MNKMSQKSTKTKPTTDEVTAKNLTFSLTNKLETILDQYTSKILYVQGQNASLDTLRSIKCNALSRMLVEIAQHLQEVGGSP
jgi:hypothetical protein